MTLLSALLLRISIMVLKGKELGTCARVAQNKARWGKVHYLVRQPIGMPYYVCLVCSPLGTLDLSRFVDRSTRVLLSTTK